MYGKPHQERSIKRWLTKLDHKTVLNKVFIEDTKENKDFIEMKKTKSKKMVKK